jgi:hypothetical protein
MRRNSEHKIKNIAPLRVSFLSASHRIFMLTLFGVFDTVFPSLIISRQIKNRGGTKTRSTTQRSVSTSCMTDTVLRGGTKSSSRRYRRVASLLWIN